MGEKREFDNKELFSLHRSVIEEHMEFLYKGHINEDVVNVLLEIVKKKFEEFKIDYALRKKIYNIAVECLENISDHGVKNTGKDSIFIIGKIEGLFFIGTGNIITKETSIKLESSLNKINGLDRDSLKNLYKEIISDQIDSDSNDVGLGLIDIALKAQNKINYQIKEVNDNQDFFSFQVKIKTDV